MAALAPAVAPMPVSLTAFFSSPVLMTLTFLHDLAHQPACLQRQQVDFGQAELLPARQGDFAVELQQVLRLEATLGQAPLQGIWPPSKPTLW
jgi:hypothetical protein